MMSDETNAETGNKVQILPVRREPAEPGFTQRVLIFFGIGTLFLLLLALLWFAASVVLLIFSSILVAVLLHDASGILEKRLPLSRGPALGLVLFLMLALFALAGWFLAPQVVAQGNQLVTDLPAAMQRARDFLERHHPLQEIVRSLPPPDKMLSDASALMARAGTVFSGVLGAFGNLAIILFVAIYLAAQPGAYTAGILRLFPKQRRARVGEVISRLGETLSLWLGGKLLSMAIVGTATAIGLTLLGVPLSLALCAACRLARLHSIYRPHPRCDSRTADRVLPRPDAGLVCRLAVRRAAGP